VKTKKHAFANMMKPNVLPTVKEKKSSFKNTVSEGGTCMPVCLCGETKNKEKIVCVSLRSRSSKVFGACSLTK